ncbi:hypothetical protein J3459_011840 [Metarhizium acridum]|uniref:uncharacterized protein n=1 Tax=Metarhizium acridum TaxID=92637 RepID=UPI001C6B514E|nr:hypothetical protein J3458_009555 [Metarhizium acridum]KAG8418980.1 hypothetical protein J3459_011840 [Metarhizium acridum]
MTWASSQGSGFANTVQLMRQAAETDYAANFTDRLTSGYGTSVGPRGTFYHLILDEATASVDSASEQVAASGKRAVISIAHRLLTIQGADNIIVLEAGHVIARGTYTDNAKADKKKATMESTK